MHSDVFALHHMRHLLRLHDSYAPSSRVSQLIGVFILFLIQLLVF